jgi:hypothetical protein
MHFQHKFMELAFPASGFAFIFAQEVGGDTLEKWGSMTAAVVISCLLAYIITQRDPKAQEKVAELIKNLNDKFTATIDTLQREQAATIKHITEKHTTSNEKSQQEYVIAMQGITKDCKELVDSVVGKLVVEQGEQRRDLMAWTRGWESESEDRSRASGNDKKGFGP